MTWQDTTPEQKQDLVRQAIVTNGLSYGQAALLLGTSRVAVAGVVERSKRKPNPIVTTAPHKLAQQRKSAADARQKKAPREKPVKKPHQGLTNLVPLAPVLDAEPVSAGAWVPLPGSTPVPLSDLTNNCCKWSVGEDRPHLFCALPTDGGPWCAEHAKRAWRPLPNERGKAKQARNIVGGGAGVGKDR